MNTQKRVLQSSYRYKLFLFPLLVKRTFYNQLIINQLNILKMKLELKHFTTTRRFIFQCILISKNILKNKETAQIILKGLDLDVDLSFKKNR